MLEKAKTIVKAFTDSLPEGQDWYQKRVDICSTCPLNSANIPDEDLTFMQKVEKKTKAGICDEGNYCTACGCCILRKCSVKTETCGAKEVGQTPKWLPIEISSPANGSIEVLRDVESITYPGSEFLIDLGTTSDPVVKVPFLLKNKSSIQFIKHSVSCGCTHLKEWKQLNSRSVKFDVEISTVNFREGLNEKTISIEFQNQQGKYLTSVVRFRVIKTK
jgi:hypothetical protein